jgi:hypothetical protein
MNKKIQCRDQSSWMAMGLLDLDDFWYSLHSLWLDIPT